jgi:hypothetical protein
MPAQRDCKVGPPHPARASTDHHFTTTATAGWWNGGWNAIADEVNEQMAHDHHDRDTVVVERSGSGVGMILGVVAVIALLVALWWFMLGPGAAGTTNNTDVDVNIPVPSVQVPAPSPEG